MRFRAKFREIFNETGMMMERYSFEGKIRDGRRQHLDGNNKMKNIYFGLNDV